MHNYVYLNLDNIDMTFNIFFIYQNQELETLL